jgi:hypothetical protein
MNWTCEALGKPAPDRLGCSWPGSVCSHNKLCCHATDKCVRRKENVEAYCTNWDAEGDEWLGGARQEYEVAPVAPEEARGTSLFCLMGVLPGSNEEQLRDIAAAKNGSIFGCDESAVFDTWQAEFVHEGGWNSVANTDVFKSVWNEVKKDGRYKKYDWTVKVDADSVFFPDRLKWHLQNMNPPKKTPIYVKNCNGGFGFYGAIEVFSREALDELFWNGNVDNCAESVQGHSGEDQYLKECMDMIGVGFMQNSDVLNTAGATSCGDPNRVCFHPFKSTWAWEGCYNQVVR